jgi:GalNAc-alpha-(1->4)-GalNAc-alpha-(1->3)-diNAcBac-PP-undecaprenol alpha-1,4-N-acetyl-D-galactosaminyltransferase
MSRKICIVSPSLKIGGIERALTVLANYFVDNGHEVCFISCLAGEHFYKLDAKVNIVEPSFRRSSSSLNKVFHYLKTVLFIRKKVRAFKPDVVLSFGDNFNPLVLMALTGLRYPVFISDRTSPDFKFSRAIAVGKKLLYPKARGFIAQTPRSAEFKRKQFGDRLKIQIIPNAIKQVTINGGLKKKQIICVSRLSREKGIERLLRAFALIEDRKDWTLTIVGSGPQQNELVQLCNQLSITQSVEFVGRVSNVDHVLSAASIFVLPSHIEGFPNALCEAMSAGLPSICFDSIPTEGIITHMRDGIIVRDGDLKGLASAISLLMEDSNLRMELGTEARKIREKYSVEAIGKQYLDFMFQN